MPRIPPSLFRRAHHISPHAATLLPTCRDLNSAANELRWIREHVRGLTHEPSPSAAAAAEHQQVAALCRRRGRGEPLQYILGTQPFGSLELKCRPGVLIPRPEPEAYATHLAALIRHHALLGPHHVRGEASSPSSLSPPPPSLRILDLCTGTGCIALLLYALLRPAIPGLHVHGVDISPRAVRLARENARHNDLLPLPLPATPPSEEQHAPAAQTITTTPLAFSQGDIFSVPLLDDLAAPSTSSSSSSTDNLLDVLVCNPPYVSRRGFARQTARSVRHWEPVLAQVPPADVPAYPAGGGGLDEPEDVFYARLLDVGARLRPAVMLFEVGDMAQALRVVGMTMRHAGLASAAAAGKVEVEVWRDWPDAAPAEDEDTAARLSLGEGGEHREVRIRGSGHGRSVFIQCR